MKKRNTGLSGTITLIWCGLLLAAPLAAGAADITGHGTGGGNAMSTPHVTTVSERRLLDSTLAQVSSLELHLVEIRTGGSEVEILAAENSLRESENLLISLMARMAGVPIATITTMHASGVPYNRIGYDLGVLAHHSGISADGHGMIGAAGDMTEIGAVHHPTAYQPKITGSGDRVRRVGAVDYVAGEDYHHNGAYGYETNGHSVYSDSYNHHNGGGMGGMH